MQSDAISGHQWSSVVISGHRGLGGLAGAHVAHDGDWRRTPDIEELKGGFVRRHHLALRVPGRIPDDDGHTQCTSALLSGTH